MDTIKGPQKYIEGYLTCLKGQARINPYPKNSLDAHDWDTGYDCGLIEKGNK